MPVGSWYQRRGKRLLDIVLGSILLVLSVPLLAVLAVVVLVSLGRPVMYVQPRAGLRGERFQIIKFRTMRHDRRVQQRHFHGHDRRKKAKRTDDPRHTRLGRVLRSTSLDELPQLLNVVKGEMSLVGPRPEIWDVATASSILDHPRHAYRPGITGTWQVKDRDPADMETKLKYDTAYVQHVSLLGDLKVLLRTPYAVLRHRGE